MVTIPSSPFKNGVISAPWKIPKPKLPPNLEQPNNSPWNYVPNNQTPGPGQMRDRKPLNDSATPSIYQSSPSYKPAPNSDPIISIPRGEDPQQVSIPRGEMPTVGIPYGEKPKDVYSIQNANAYTSPQVLNATPTGQFSITSNPASTDLSAASNPFQSSTFQAQASAPSGGTKTPGTKTPVSKKPLGKSPSKPKSATDKFLAGDADYQATLRDLARALTDFKARQNVERTRAGTEYGYAKRTAGLQRDQDLKDIADDFAARGIVRSGVYGTRLGDYNTQYSEKTAELGRQYNNQLGDFSTALRDFVRNQALQKEAAREAAIRRRAAKLGKIS